MAQHGVGTEDIEMQEIGHSSEPSRVNQIKLKNLTRPIANREEMGPISDKDIGHFLVMRPLGYSHHFLAYEKCPESLSRVHVIHKNEKKKKKKNKGVVNNQCISLDFNKNSYFQYIEGKKINRENVKDCIERESKKYNLFTANCQHFAHNTFTEETNCCNISGHENQCSIVCSIFSAIYFLVFVVRIGIPILFIFLIEGNDLAANFERHCVVHIITYYDIGASVSIFVLFWCTEEICRCCVYPTIWYDDGIPVNLYALKRIKKHLKSTKWNIIIFGHFWNTLGYMITSVSVSLSIRLRQERDGPLINSTEADLFANGTSNGTSNVTCPFKHTEDQANNAWMYILIGVGVFSFVQLLVTASFVQSGVSKRLATTQALTGSDCKCCTSFPEVLYPWLALVIGTIYIAVSEDNVRIEIVIGPLLGFSLAYIFISCLGGGLIAPDLSLDFGLFWLMLTIARINDSNDKTWQLPTSMVFVILIFLCFIAFIYITHWAIIVIGHCHIDTSEAKKELPHPTNWNASFQHYMP